MMKHRWRARSPSKARGTRGGAWQRQMSVSASFFCTHRGVFVGDVFLRPKPGLFHVNTAVVIAMDGAYVHRFQSTKSMNAIKVHAL